MSKEKINIGKIKTKEVELPKMLSMADIQNHLGVSRSTISKLAKLDSFPKTRIGGRILVAEDDYLNWLRKIKGKDIKL